MNIVPLLILATVWAALYIVARKIASSSERLSNFHYAAPIIRHAQFLTEVIGATGLLALATVAFFWQILLTPDTWMPAGGGDLAPFLYPNYRFAAHYLGQGIIPLWNPHLYSGTPFAADIQSGLFYPINLLLFLFVPNLTFEWLQYLAIFHFWLAGSTMYLCLRLLRPASLGAERGQDSEPGQLQAPDHGPGSSQTPGLKRNPGSPYFGQAITPLAAFAGALAFEFSDLFIVHFGNLNMIAVAAWLPLIFLLFHLSLARSSPGLAAASGAVLAMATLAGHIQITLFILLSLGLYTLWHLRLWLSRPRLAHVLTTSTLFRLGAKPDRTGFRLWTFDSSPAASSSSLPLTAPAAVRSNVEAVPDPSRLAPFRPILLLLITFLVTVGLAALLLVPAYEMSQYTPRAELPYREAARFSLHPVQLVGLLIPNYFGRDPALHWGPWERTETGYIGVITLVLAAIGALLHRGQLKGYFITLGIVALLLAMGGYTLAHGWLYATVPGFNQLRAPARFILLVDFSLAILAAFGLNQLLQPRTGKAQIILANLLKTLTWSLGALIIVAAPLGYYAMLVTQDRNPAIFNRAVGAATGVATFAIFTIAGLVVLYLIHNHWLREKRAGVAVILLIGLDLFTLGYNVDIGHANPVAGFEHPQALAFLHSDPNLYRVEVTTDVWHAWQPNSAMLNGTYDAWGLYNPLTLADTTLYWSSVAPRSSNRYNFLGIKYIIASKAGAPADGDIVPVFDSDPQINIYLNQNTMAPIQFVGQTTVVSDHDAAWEAIHGNDFDPTRRVILEEGQPLDTQPTSSLAILQYDLHTVTIGVETDQPGYLVLADAYFPGWQATVGGRPQPIRRANFAFRAVLVPAGQHTVQFIFDPIIWKVGLGISGGTLLVLVGWAGWRPRRGRKYQEG